MFNMDETGYTIGPTQSTQVVVVRDQGNSARGQALKAQKPRQEWVTMVECVSASGIAIPPLVIFKGKKFHDNWLPTGGGNIEGWRWSASESGWTSNYLAMEWLEHVFHPTTLPTDPPHRRLLILDGHGSHVQSPFVAFCMAHNIDLMVLPPHSSHVTQPLDVGIFGPLKRELAVHSDRDARYNPGRVSKATWSTNLVKAREKAMSKANIEVGWRTTGLHPFNPHRVFRSLPSPSTPPPETRTSRAPLGSMHENQEMFRNYPAATPVKNRMYSLSSSLESSNARITLLEKEIGELQRYISPERKRRRGFTVNNIRTHHFSSEEGYRRVLEEESISKRRKGKERAVQQESANREEMLPGVQQESESRADGMCETREDMMRAMQIAHM